MSLASISDSAVQLPLIVGVTGHRDLLPEDIPTLMQTIDTCLDDLKRQFPDLPIWVITGLAEGADTLVTEIAVNTGCKIVNLLPRPLGEYTKEFGDEARNKLLELTATHPTLHLSKFDSALEPEDDDTDLAYEQMGRYIASHCHILLALWDGEHLEARGGTSQVVKFHLHNAGLADSSQLRSQVDLGNDESDLVLHIPCSRSSTVQTQQNRSQASPRWLTRDTNQPQTKQMPERYVSVFNAMSEFNQDAGKLKLLPSTTLESSGAPEAFKHLQSLFDTSDQLAHKFQNRTIWTLRITLLCTLLAGLSFVVYADLPDQPLMIWGYLLCALVGTASYGLAHRLQWQRRYHDYRVLAESVRVQYYWARAGVKMQNPSSFSHDAFHHGRDLQMGWIRHAMRFGGLLVNTPVEVSKTQTDAVVSSWVGDEDRGQLGYYRAKAHEKLSKHRTTQRTTSIAFAIGLLAALVLALGDTYFEGIINNALVALMGSLPIMAAVRQNYGHRLAERELAAQYAHMLAVFENAYNLLDHAEEQGQFQSILRDLGETALDENAQWVLRQRERPLAGSDAGL